MHCPVCSGPTAILETRRGRDVTAVRRRRRCSRCEHRFTTFERIEPSPLVVIKRNGRRQRFDPTKLRAGLVRACHKRDVDPRELDLIVQRVEGAAREGGGEIAAKRIGELCLEGLEPLDRGAFLQFAGTLPDGGEGYLENPRKDGDSGRAVSVRDGEDAQRPIPEQRARGVF